MRGFFFGLPDMRNSLAGDHKDQEGDAVVALLSGKPGNEVKAFSLRKGG
jgi:hypothetical protein